MATATFSKFEECQIAEQTLVGDTRTHCLDSLLLADIALRLELRLVCTALSDLPLLTSGDLKVA